MTGSEIALLTASLTAVSLWVVWWLLGLESVTGFRHESGSHDARVVTALVAVCLTVAALAAVWWAIDPNSNGREQ